MNSRAHKTQTAESKAAANNLPLQQAGEAVLFSDNRPEHIMQKKIKTFANENGTAQLKSFEAIAQLKRKRNDDEEKKDKGQLATQLSRDRNVVNTENENVTRTVQRVVAENAPADTKIVIDNPGASDFGDTGVIRRPSRSVAKCKAVEFDNEPGVLYRVFDYEMSPALSNQTDTEELPAFFSMTATNGEHNLVITGDFNMQDPRMKEITFTATKDGKEVGHVNMGYYEGVGFVIPDIKTKGVPGLGTVLMQIASTMALKLNQRIIALVAVKFPPSQHPGPFYLKYGFRSVPDLTNWGGNLAAYLLEKGDPNVDMTGRTDEVRENTTNYITGKGWAFSTWREGKN